MHLPHPHPNGGFSDPLLEGGMVLLLCIAALVVEVEPACDSAMLVLTLF